MNRREVIITYCATLLMAALIVGCAYLGDRIRVQHLVAGCLIMYAPLLLICLAAIIYTIAEAPPALLNPERKRKLQIESKSGAKEPKSADSIPSDCMSDAKCEDRWHKTANSLPDNGMDVLAKDALGNYLIASFDGAEWFVSVYDGEDHPVLHTPPILEWCEIPSGNQKGDFRDVTKMVEQKPVEWNDTDMKEARDNLISVCRDWERGWQTALLPIVAVRARYFLEHLTEPKPETVPNPAIPNPSMTEMPDHDLVKELRRRGYDMTCKKTIEL